MDSFEHNTSPARVVFGNGTVARLPDEIKRLSASRPLLLSTANGRSRTTKLVDALQNASIQVAGVFPEAVMHTPTHITNKAVVYAQQRNADCLVSFGGGSTIGLGKAISIRTGLKHIAIPTTYSGSEMTPILGETQDGTKTTRSDPQVLPCTVIYDVTHTLTLSPGLSAVSGVNAIAHAGKSRILPQHKFP
jgi:alcohol dehydrogenase class IV